MWKKKVSFLVLLVFLNSFALAWAEENGSGEEAGAVTAEQDKESPEAIKEYIEKGNAYAKSEQWQLAIEEYAKAIAGNEANAEAYEARGRSYMALKQYKDALMDYDKALTLEPGRLEARFRKSVCCYYTGDYELGLGDAEQVIALQPTHAGSYLIKAVCLQKLNRTPEAVETYKSLLKHVPADASESQEAIAMAKKMLKRLGAA